VPEFGAFWLMRPWLSSVTPLGDGHPVLVLPGLMADDGSTSALRNFLNSHGYTAHGWNQGRNFGLRANLERDMLARIDELFECHGRSRISLVGWSLGGLYARRLAKIVPDKVRCLISLGSPFAGSPKSTNAWRTYEIVSGCKVEDQDVLDTLVEAPPVLTTSIFSRTDGICAWQACLNKDEPQAENIEVYGSHCGAIIRRWSTPSPIASPSPRAPGRSSIAVAGAILSFRTGSALERAIPWRSPRQVLVGRACGMEISNARLKEREYGS
jgi:pimeloyl-ACP methyl ester carboxylesterase